jgi:hypothetical protein
MLRINLDKQTKVVELEPISALSQQDFQSVATIVDPFIDEFEKLNGIIIYTKSFPGWDSFSTLMKHLQFVSDYHKKISSVAFVIDSILGDLAEKIATHFVSATVKHFNFKDLDNAKKWIIENSKSD